MNLKRMLKDTGFFIKGFFMAFEEKSTRMIEFEVDEMENIFSLMIFGTFTGMPAPPPHITLQLMPLMHEEIINMLDSVETASDPIGKLGNIFDCH